MKLDIQPKILAAFVSLCTLLIAQFAFLFAHDLFYDTFKHPMGWQERIEYDNNFRLGNLFMIGIFALPVLIWHFADLSMLRPTKSKIVSLFLGFRTMYVVLLTGLVGTALVLSGLTERMQCWQWTDVFTTEEADGLNEFGFWCHPSLYNNIEYWSFPFAFALMVIAIARACYAIYVWAMPKTAL